MRSGPVPALADSLLIRAPFTSVHKKSPQEHELLKAPTPPADAPSRTTCIPRYLQRRLVASTSAGRHVVVVRLSAALQSNAAADSIGRAVRLRRRPAVSWTAVVRGPGDDADPAAAPAALRAFGRVAASLQERGQPRPGLVPMPASMSPICHRSFPEPLPTAAAAAATIDVFRPGHPNPDERLSR